VAVTRAIGDYRFDNNKCHKLEGLSCIPDITRTSLLPNDEFIIVACDGLWDIFKTDVVVSDCRRILRKYNDCQKAAELLVKSALDQHATDNISVIVIGFSNKNIHDNNLYIVQPINKLQSRFTNRRVLRRKQESSSRILNDNNEKNDNNDINNNKNGNDTSDTNNNKNNKINNYNNNNLDENTNADNDVHKNVSVESFTDIRPSRSH